MCCLVKVCESVSIPKVKEVSALINDSENIIAYSEEFKQSDTLAVKCRLFHTISRWRILTGKGGRGRHSPRKTSKLVFSFNNTQDGWSKRPTP